MCGIAGYWDPERVGDGGTSILKAMTETIRHRGPDDQGHWVRPERGVGLGHRRLSIVDLSPLGYQPMLSRSGRSVIVFNGEIYNHRVLRAELEAAGAVLRGHSDTEVLVEAIERFGLQAAVDRCVGMFAFALFDHFENSLHLVRDRLGEKPLYVGTVGKGIVFASEIRAIATYPGWDGAIDRDALSLYLRHNYVPAPRSIFRQAKKIQPGTIATYRPDRSGKVKLLSVVPYWSAGNAVTSGAEAPYVGSEASAVDVLDGLVRQSIRDQMIADVPVGAFLSGGIDSSLVVAIMQAESSQAVRTFTIGFHEQEFDEAPYAAAVASHLGTNHTELYITSDDALSVVPTLANVFDEPFADSSQIPTILVSRLARQDVTVSLSGDGGDELFGGYTRYKLAMSLWNRMRRIPKPLRRMVGSGMRSLSPRAWDLLLRGGDWAVPQQHRGKINGHRLHRAGTAIGAPSFAELYRQMISHWDQPKALVIGGDEPETPYTEVGESRVRTRDNYALMMYRDSVAYLPDDLLVKVDRAAMSVSLESRAPLLDHRIFEFAWTLPTSYKVDAGQGKRILRSVLAKYVPPSLFERPKMGFAAPIGAWLRGPLKDWGAALLAPKQLRDQGFFDPGPVARAWEEHQRGVRDWQYHLWDVLMFQSWYEGGASGSR